jgi:hypothetical protein
MDRRDERPAMTEGKEGAAGMTRLGAGDEPSIEYGDSTMSMAIYGERAGVRRTSWVEYSRPGR